MSTASSRSSPPRTSTTTLHLHYLCKSGCSRFSTPEITRETDFSCNWQSLTTNREAITRREGFLADQLSPDPEQARLPGWNPNWYAPPFRRARGFYPQPQRRRVSESCHPRLPHIPARCRQSTVLSTRRLRTDDMWDPSFLLHQPLHHQGEAHRRLLSQRFEVTEPPRSRPHRRYDGIRIYWPERSPTHAHAHSGASRSLTTNCLHSSVGTARTLKPTASLASRVSYRT
jgi:hypothetical protein